MRQTLGSAECPTCQTSFSGLPLESDGDITYAVLESRPCALCGAPLCECCARVQCDGCGQSFCQSHRVEVPDGTSRPLACCPACAAECEPLARCPHCGSDATHTDYLSFGIESETGYDDAHAVFTCRACGAQGDSEELVFPELLPARREPGRAELPERALPASA